MSNVSVSSKGQIVIPKALRQRLGLRAGSRLSVTESGGTLQLKPEQPRTSSVTVAQGRGLAGYRGSRVSEDEMAQAVRARAASANQGARRNKS